MPRVVVHELGVDQLLGEIEVPSTVDLLQGVPDEPLLASDIC